MDIYRRKRFGYRVLEVLVVLVVLVIVAGAGIGGFPMMGDESRIAAGNDEELIRFHVVANSDSKEDQALKRAVRDAILQELSPRLAEAASAEESRSLIKELSPQMERIARSVIEAWGMDYEVKVEYGEFIFPTKSYGSLVLPAGEYEALRISIGEAEGSNWWCLLFPALCFVDIEHATAVQVDGKPGIPISENANSEITNSENTNSENAKPKFWFWEKIKLLFG